MATFTAKSGKYTLTLTVTEGTQDIANNTSPVNWSLTLVSNGGTLYHWNDTCPWNVKLNGTQVGSGTYSYDLRDGGTQTIISKSGSTTITHNGDGTKSISVYAYTDMDNSAYVSPMSISDTFTLTTIPRASDVSVASSYSIANTSSSLSATISPKANFYHRWKWSIGSYTSGWTTLEQSSATQTISVANTSMLSQLPTATSGSVTFTVETHNGSAYSSTTLVGSKTATSTVSVNTSNIKPSVSLGTIGINSSPISGYAVAGYSKVQSAWTTTNSSGATSVTTYFTVSTGSLATTSSTSTSGTVVSNVIPSNSSNYTLTIYAYAKDSRGAVSATVSKAITVYGYQPPTANLSAYRTTSSSSTNEDGAGTYAYVTFSGAVRSTVNNQNSIQSTSCTYSGSISGTATSGGHYALADTQSVTFKLTVTDKVTSSTASVTIATASYPLDLYDNGSGTVGVGLGAVAEGKFVRLGDGLHPKGGWLLTNDIMASDLNQVTESMVGYTTSTSNRPSDYGTCYTFGLDGTSSSSWYSQIAFGTNGIIYFRNSINSLGQTWSAWSSFYGAFNPQTSVANATNATTADQVKIVTNNPTSWATRYIPFVTQTSGNLIEYANDGLVYVTNEGTTTSGGRAFIYLGNAKASGTAGNKTGGIAIYSNSAYYAFLQARGSYTANSTFEFPQGGGIVEAYTTLWTGTLKGGSTMSLDVSAYSRIKVYAKLYAVTAVYEIDLSSTNAHEQISGYRYSNGATVAEFTAGGSLEYLISQSLVSTDKKTFYHYHCGYQAVGGSYTARDSNAEYYVYRIDGLV